MVINLNYKAITIVLLLGLLLVLYPSSVYSESDLVPVNGATVTLTYSDGSVLVLTTDGDGRATGLVRPGLYQSIRVSGPTIKSYVMNDVNIDTNNNQFNITVERSQWLSGNIFVGGSSAEGVQVADSYAVMADSNGRYALPVGDSVNPLVSYSQLAMFLNIYNSPFWEINGMDELLQMQVRQYLAVMHPARMSNMLFMNETIDLSSYTGQELITHDVNLQQSLTISGVVTDASGSPIANASIFVYSPNDSYLWGYATSDANGNYVISSNIKDGETYILQAVARGYSFINTSLVVSGDTVFNIQLKQSVVIKGHVRDAGGTPLSNIQVYATSDSGWSAYAFTDSNGYFELTSGFGVGENVTLSYGDIDVIRSFGMYGYKVQSIITVAGDNVVDLVYDIPTIVISGSVDDVDRAGFLEQVFVEITPHPAIPISIPIPTFKVPVNSDGSFSIKMPTMISMFGFDINISTVDISVGGTYYYPSVSVATGLGADQDINLGTIQITSHPVIEVTIYVYTTRSNINLPDFHHELNIKYKHWVFPMAIDTNSSLSSLMATVAPNNGTIMVWIVGPTGTEGYLRLTVPKSFLAPPYSVYIDGVQSTFNLVGENATHVTIEITYGHSEHVITVTSTAVIPEFPIELYTVVTLLIAAVLTTLYFKRYL